MQTMTSGPKKSKSIQTISVIVPDNPFAPQHHGEVRQCLCALNVEKLMEWWPGTPHSPHRNPAKVLAIQRSLDWKRVAHIAAYLLQREILDAPEKLNLHFKHIYEPRKNEPGREWPPRISSVIGFQRSVLPVFSNVLLHINGAKIEQLDSAKDSGAANLVFDEHDENLYFSVIDGQHRINGAYLALKLLQQTAPAASWEIPAEVFLDLDPPNGPPRVQAQIFIDVNFYQKKVDKSLVADLFPTARGKREPLDNKERTQDIGRKLMLETGPLVGMIQIPGIKYGVKDVITLATLNGAVEDQLDILRANRIESLDAQTEFIAQCLSAWFEASGRFEDPQALEGDVLGPENVAYQGRVLVSVLTLVPAMIWKLRQNRVPYVSRQAGEQLTNWIKQVAERAGLLERGIFISKTKYRKRGYLGSGGLGRFRDLLWTAALAKSRVVRLSPKRLVELATKSRSQVFSNLPK